jgi:hypothetical protein
MFVTNGAFPASRSIPSGRTTWTLRRAVLRQNGNVPITSPFLVSVLNLDTADTMPVVLAILDEADVLTWPVLDTNNCHASSFRPADRSGRHFESTAPPGGFTGIETPPRYTLHPPYATRILGTGKTREL